IDFGAESSRPTLLLSTLLSPPVTRRKARLATGLPATALAGLDFHQLDSFERFHPLTKIPLPQAWLGAINALCSGPVSALRSDKLACGRIYNSKRTSSCVSWNYQPSKSTDHGHIKV